MPQININAWGEGFWLSDDYLNKRTGTSSITDQDYTDFQPFAFMSRELLPPSPNVNTVCLQKLYSLGMCQLNEPLDGSICYVGMYNSDLPQLNIGVLYPGDTVDDPTFKTDNTQVQSYFLYSNLELFGYFSPTNQYMPDGYLVKPSYNSGTPAKYLHWSDDGFTGTGYNTDVEAMKQYNTNLKIDPVLKFGVKSLFLVIYVVYISSLDSSGQPISTQTTLNDYLNGSGHDDAWKQAHPVMCAFARPYMRRNINGEYDTLVYSGADICPAFTLSLNGTDDNTEHHIIQYMSATNGITNQNAPVNNGCFPIYGQIVPTHYNEPRGSSSFSAPAYLGYNRGTYKKAPTNDVYWFELDLTDPDNVEYLMRGCAAYGLFFSDDVYTLNQSGRDETRWIDSHMCCGTIDENGRTNGDYTRGALNATQKQFNWSDSTESPFDPSAPPVPPPMPYDDSTVFNDIGNIATLTRRYALTSSDVEALGAELWQISSDLINSVQNDEWTKYTADVIDTFLVNDPLSCIVSLEKYPMTIPDKSGPVTVKLGKAETSISADITSATTHTYSFKGQLIQPKYGNSFLDYEPYTHMELYVPFCGTVSLDPRDYMGHTLNIRLVVDFTTGTCVGYIMSDNLVIDTVNGSIAVSIPVTGIDSTTLAANITNGIINTRNARYNHIFGTLGKVASPAGIVSNVSNLWSSANTILTSQETARAAEYELSHQPAPPHTIGSASPIGSWAIDFKARLLIYYPTGEIIDNSKEFLCFNDAVFYKYQEQIGFARVDPVAQLSEHYRGLVVAIAPVLSGMTTDTSAEPATDPELQLIARALEEGVII